MVRITYTLISCLVAGLVAGTPTPQTNIEDNNRRLLALSEAESMFPGIYWREARDTCTEDQFNDLVATTKASMGIVQEVAGRWEYSSAFHRFFIRPKHVSAAGDWPEYNLVFYQALVNNIKNVQNFPQTGRKNRQGKVPRTGQVGYTCKPRLSRCDNKAVAAFTNFENENGGWWVSFCPTYWAQKHHGDILNGPAKKPTDLPFMSSRELVMIHEWMHNNVMGFDRGTKEVLKVGSPQIVDVVDDLPELKNTRIYGPTPCAQFAWKYEKLSASKVNVQTVMNADNYAWFFVSHSFENKWKWSSNMNDWNIEPLNKRDGAQPDTNEPVPDPSYEIKASDLDISQPSAPLWNCQGSTNDSVDDVHCDYVGMDYEASIAASQQSFTSVGNCTLSKECWKSQENQGPAVACTCTCDGKLTYLRDNRCNGYAGDLAFYDPSATAAPVAGPTVSTTAPIKPAPTTTRAP